MPRCLYVAPSILRNVLSILTVNVYEEGGNVFTEPSAQFSFSISEDNNFEAPFSNGRTLWKGKCFILQVRKTAALNGVADSALIPPGQ